MKAAIKVIVKSRLDDAAKYAKQARAAVQVVDRGSFQASLRGARFMLDAAEKYFTEGMEND